MKVLCSFLLAAAAIIGAQIPNLTGTWNLNVQKSSWGKKIQPQSVVVNLEHAEPRFKYSGATSDINGNRNTFELDTTIDGQEHPVKTSYGPGRMTMKRSNPYTITSDFRSDDGKFAETATTTVSPDGRTMTRRMHTKSPDGEATWTEVYDKQ
jgi:hypothetical protein